MTEHTSKRFGAELEDIRSKFLRMGGLVESMLIDVSGLLANGDLNLVERVLAHEKEVNKLEVEIDHSITEVMALNQPTAIDLRMLLSVSKMLTDLERSGDEAEKVAKSLRRIYEGGSVLNSAIGLDHMCRQVIDMLHRMLDSFARYDAPSAADVVLADKKVDKEWKMVLRTLSSYMIEDPRTISSSIDQMFIARSLERIGDHAKNMSERVIYLVQGEDVRHTGAKNAVTVASNNSVVI